MAKKREAIVPEVVGVVDQEIVTTGSTITAFLGNMVAFFKTSAELEQQAQSNLLAAKKLTAPANAAEDEKIQAFIKTTNAHGKKIEGHWDTVTSAFYTVHRKLTARRGIGTKADEDAARIAQTLHNNYVQAEQRRAAEENRRRQQEAEERARRDRERELQEIEAEAIRREEALDDLSEREKLFVDYYTNNGNNGLAAAQRAGFRDALASSARLLSKAKIQQAIHAKYEADRLRQQARGVAQRPLDVGPVEEVKPDVTKAAGAYDRSTHSAEVLDLNAFRGAAFSGTHGIPWDIFVVDPAKLNEYARSMRETINRWPGVRYKKNTSTV